MKWSIVGNGGCIENKLLFQHLEMKSFCVFCLKVSQRKVFLSRLRFYFARQTSSEDENLVRKSLLTENISNFSNLSWSLQTSKGKEIIRRSECKTIKFKVGSCRTLFAKGITAELLGNDMIWISIKCPRNFHTLTLLSAF